MTSAEILKNLRKGETSPVYFLTGEEPYFIDEISDYIEDHILEDQEKDFNLNVIYGGDTTLDQIMTSAKRFPMMAERQVVIVKEAQSLKDWKSKDKTEALARYLDAPLQSTILVFQHKYKKLDGRSQITKDLKKKSIFFEGKKIREDRLPEWITSHVTAKNRKIDNGTANLLSEYLGNDLSKVVNALEKLCVLISEGEQITSLHVEKNIGISKDYNVFEFQKALGKMDGLKANKIINYFSANPKDHPLQLILPNLYSYFSKLIKLHRIPAGENVARFIGVNPYFLNDYNVAKKNYSAGHLARIIGHLRTADVKSKGVDNPSTPASEILKELTFKILHDPR